MYDEVEMTRHSRNTNCLVETMIFRLRSMQMRPILSDTLSGRYLDEPALLPSLPLPPLSLSPPTLPSLLPSLSDTATTCDARPGPAGPSRGSLRLF